MSEDDQAWAEVEDAVELLVEEQTAEALVALGEIAKRNPRNAYAFHYLGVGLRKLGRAAEARDAYRAALRLAPGYLGARIGLSHTLRELGEHAEAIAEADEALRRFPGDGEALYAAGLAYAARGDVVLARRRLQAFLATGPDLEVVARAEAELARLDEVVAARKKR